jgi:multiple sugar transport system substrate-binding protein
MQQSSKDIGQAYQPVIDSFVKTRPGVKVKITAFPYAQYRDKVLVAMKGGTGPDILALDQIWTPEFAAAGLIAPLDDYIAKSSVVTKDKFFTGAWDSNGYEGKTWGVPLNADVWEQLYYNADLFEKAGLDPDEPPTTWDQWLQVAGKLNAPPNQFGISLIGCKDEGAVVTTNSLMFSNGGSVAQGKQASYDSPENRAALEMYKKLVAFAPTGTAGACEQDAVGRFTSGKAAMLLAGSWQQDTMKQAAKFDWRIATPPAPEGKQFAGALGGFNMAVNKKTADPALAFAFVEHLSTPENQAAVNSLIPALRDAGKAFLTANRKQPEVVLDTLEKGKPRPLSPVYPQLSQVQQDTVQAVLGGTPVDQALSKAQADMTKILEQLP